MFGPYKAILRQPLHCVSSYVSQYLHATAARCLYLRMYAHTSLTVFSYCGVHAVFLWSVAYLSRACIPCIDIRYNDASFLTHIVPFQPFPNRKLSFEYICMSSKHGEEDCRMYSELRKVLPLCSMNADFCITK
jgi:hypothetical protein